MPPHLHPGPGKRQFNWSWLKVRGVNDKGSPASGQPMPQVGPNNNYKYKRTPLFGTFSNGFNAFGPYRRPIMDATAGGLLVQRQLNSYALNDVFQQTNIPVSITGDGSQLQGQYVQSPLVNVTTQEQTTTTNAAGNVVVTTTNVNGSII